MCFIETQGDNGSEQILPFFFFLDLFGVGDGGALRIELINATKVASALWGGNSLQFFDLGETS